MAGKTIQVKVRMPLGFHRKLMRDAESGGQTLNGEILRRLEQSFDAEDIKAENQRTLERIEQSTRHIQSIVTALKGSKSDDQT